MNDVLIELWGGPLDGEVFDGLGPDRPIYSEAGNGMHYKYVPADTQFAWRPVRYVYRGMVTKEEAWRGE